MTDAEREEQIRQAFLKNIAQMEIERLQKELDDARADIAQLTALQITHEGHGKPCYYCGEPCSALSGNPGLWPVGLPHRDDPGVIKWHHSRCVTLRLDNDESRTTLFVNKEFTAAERRGRVAMREEAALIARKYADAPCSGPANNTQEAFDLGMNHRTGAVDNAIAIEEAIRALPDAALITPLVE